MWMRLWPRRQRQALVLVHGCFGSSGRFRGLAQVLAFHGQQTACFTYNDRDSMMLSSRELIAILQRNGILNPTAPQRRADLNLLLAKLYGEAN